MPGVIAPEVVELCLPATSAGGCRGDVAPVDGAVDGPVTDHEVSWHRVVCHRVAGISGWCGTDEGWMVPMSARSHRISCQGS